MNCLKNETIQAFLDNELAPEQVSQVKKHLKKCSICRVQLNSYKKDLTTIKNHLANQTPAEQQVIVPPFRKPAVQQKNIWPKIRIYAVAAAIATLISFSFIIRQYKADQKEMEHLKFREQKIMQQASMNEQWQKRMITITIKDKKGNIVEQIATSGN
ncbi:putative transmembrane transcriptional regulator (anti-sigma factor) [Salinivirga cyanobacteriivorans]|uniref:Putative transmembrane transcriptional regulator (Anti-sigma factor) n=2 Tax=Salinivirga cyanobacteriivorans TaxID=1307839 RepID=A0A0S2I201_9BACT|nr:putative transmembrane transcriptional regulator (anti-sigma factor) [Salinivirga cyanobacteriivorans]